MILPLSIMETSVIGIAVILGRILVGFAVDRIFAPTTTKKG